MSIGLSLVCFCIKLSNALVFPDPDGPIINILYGHFLLVSIFEAKELFQILPFYNVLTEKSKIKHLSNIELLQEFPFYDELSVVEISKAFKRCARSYKVQII